MQPASVTHDDGHAALAPLHTNGAHEGLPAPLTSAHTPLVAAPYATVHASQAPAHAVLQQTPSTQLPEEHCAVAEQPVPFACLAMQAPPEQYEVEAQFALVAHAVGHDALAPSHT